MSKCLKILDVPVNKVNIAEALDISKEFIKNTNKCNMIVTPNSEIVMNAQEDIELMKIIEGAELVVPDGIGLVYASRIYKDKLEERVTGIDLLNKILEYCGEKSKSVYFFGSSPGVAEEAAKNIKKKYSNIIIKGTHHGYFSEEEEDTIVQEINDANVDFLCVALGSPKQEKFIYKYKDKLKVRIAMGVGGSLDVLAGRLKRAPLIYQKLGIEWLYRVIQEPKRYKRIAVLPLFMLKVLFDRK